MSDVFASAGFTCFCGGFGSGKTLSMVRFMAEKKEKGYFIVSNFNTKVSDMVLTDFDDFMAFLALIVKKSTDGKSGFEHDGVMPYGKKIVIAIDETGVWLNNRGFGSFPTFLMSFMLQIRKLDVIPVYAVQEPETTDVNLLRMTGQYRYHFKRFAGLMCSIKIFRYPLNNMFTTVYKQKELGSTFFFFPFQKKLFGLYNSREITIPRKGIPEVSDEISEKFDKAFTKWKNPHTQQKLIDRKNGEKKIIDRISGRIKNFFKKNDKRNKKSNKLSVSGDGRNNEVFSRRRIS